MNIIMNLVLITDCWGTVSFWRTAV